MGVNMDLEFDKYCKVGRSPRTVLPAPCPEARGESKHRAKKSCSKNADHNLLSLEEEGFTEIKFHNYRSVSCKSLPARDVELERDKVLRRGSVYQSSREQRSRRAETRGGRKKIEFSLGNESPFSFSILDTICGSDEEAEVEAVEKEKSSVVSLDLKDRQSDCGNSAQRDTMENRKFRCNQVSGPSNTGNVLKERDAFTFNKSLFAKLTLPHSPAHSEGGSSSRSSKSHFTPIKRMFDPLIKSKSHGSRSHASRSSGSSARRNKVPTKSIFHDFSSLAPNIVSTVPCVNKDHLALLPCLAAHLTGNLQMEYKHGVPYFEFSMAHSEDVFTAKTWKEEDALNLVYTFHSVHSKKRSSVTSRGIKYSNKDSPMVSQMQVSCYPCSEERDGGAASSSMVTEFVLYDIAHARKSVIAEEEIVSPESSNVLGDSNERQNETNVELDDLFSLTKPKMPSTSIVNFSSPYPWTLADLHPSLEIAAVVIQVPLEKTESLKYKRGDNHSLSHQVHTNWLDSSSLGQGTRSTLDDHSSVKVSVVIPLGNHGQPIGGESRGPSPLLKRWRSGGKCDCGGWDMSCSLAVFGNPDSRSMVEHSTLEKDQPFKLCIQGGKENITALTITMTGKGQYSVDFHAQLSALQAFAVCVAILHTSSVDPKKPNHLLERSSLKAHVEDEVVLLIEQVTLEERQKVTKTAEENPESFVTNPPISPIARV